MQLLEVILSIANFILIGTLVLFAKSYLPSYFKKKGENLATKEDIKEITDKVESVKLEYNSELEKFKIELNKDLHSYTESKQFKKTYSYSRLTELYSELYTVVVQSEYLRKFFTIKDEFDKIPFLEVNKTTNKSTIKFSMGEGVNFKSETEKVEDEITNSNKIELINKIIENKKYASQNLLKYAVVYRFVHNNYLDNLEDENIDSKFKNEELILMGKIVKEIIRDYNELRKICELDYSEYEFSEGLIEWNY